MNANIIKNATAAKPAASLQGYLAAMKPAIEAALPSVITPERFTRIVTSALSTNPKLAQCTPQSFLASMMTAAQLGLEPNTPLGQAFLIPYNSKRGLECQFQLGYKGLIDLAYRSGEIAMIQAEEVRENDLFEFEFGLEPKLRHIPARGNRGNPSHYYAVFQTKTGGKSFAVMSIEEVREFAQKYSKSFGTGPWQTNFSEMAKKTVLKNLLKYAPLKSEFVRQVSADMTVRTDIAADMTEVPTIDVEAETVSDAPEAGETKAENA